MKSGGSTLNQRSVKLTTTAVIALMATGVASAATFTPGNVVVAGVPNTAGLQQITLFEYTSSGGPEVQSYAIPNSGAAPFFGFTGTSFIGPQINFGDDSNQILYATSGYTNSASASGGYGRVNATSGTLTVDQARTNTRGTVETRGVLFMDCRTFTSQNPGLDRSLGSEAFIQWLATGNGRFLERFNGEIYVSTGSASYPGGSTTGIRKVGLPTAAAPVAPMSFIDTPGGQVLGFCFADANTVYLTITTGNPAPPWDQGVHKVTFDGSVWNDEGRNATIGAGSGGDTWDVDCVVNGSNVTLYVAQGPNVIRIDDTLSSTGATWTGATTTTIATLTGLRAKSLAIVPPAPTVPSYSVTTSTTGTGFGSVAKNPPTGPYTKCSTVQLTATANPGSIFVDWEGDASGSVNPLDVIVDSNKNIAARFDLLAGNNVLAITGVGLGSINATPPGVDLPSPGGPNNVVQPTNTVITLTATPAGNWVFDHWSGDVTPGDETMPVISITLSANKSVTCTFKELFRVRNFTTGNGTNTITGPTPDGTSVDGYPLYRDGTQVSFSATPGNIGTPANTWTFDVFQDQNLNDLSTNPTFTTAPITGPLDVTAVFDETPNTNTAQPFGAGNIVVGTIKDFTFPGVIQLREYNSAGQLVQPVITAPDMGAPSGTTNGPTSTTVFDINFDASNANRLYIAVSDIDDIVPNRVGFLRTVFQSGAHVFDLAKGHQVASDGRGTTADGDNAYYSYDGGIRRYNIPGDSISTVNSGNTRMLEIFNGALYSSTSSATGVYAGGPGIFRMDDPTGTPSTNLVFQVPTITAQAPNLLSFKFADANNCYIGLQAGNGYGGLEKFYFNGTNWVDQGSPLSLGTDWGRGVDVVVNGNDVRIYVQHTFATSEGRLGYIDDKLDNSLTWSDLPITNIVPLVSRGRSLAVVPAGAAPVCSTCLGDVVQDSKVNGVDIQGFVKCLLGVGGTNCQCGDFNGSGTVTSADIPPFITALTTSTSCP